MSEVERADGRRVAGSERVERSGVGRSRVERSGVERSGVGNALMGPLQEVGALSNVITGRLAKALGINATDLSAMESLMSEGPLTARELADRLHISTAASTHVVDRLERAGHVRRRAHETDRRKVLVEPDEESVVRTMHHLYPLLTGMDRLADGMDPAEREVITRFLAEVIGLFEAAADSIPGD